MCINTLKYINNNMALKRIRNIFMYNKCARNRKLYQGQKDASGNTERKHKPIEISNGISSVNNENQITCNHIL